MQGLISQRGPLACTPLRLRQMIRECISRCLFMCLRSSLAAGMHEHHKFGHRLKAHLGASLWKLEATRWMLLAHVSVISKTPRCRPTSASRRWHNRRSGSKRGAYSVLHCLPCFPPRSEVPCEMPQNRGSEGFWSAIRSTCGKAIFYIKDM